MIDALRPLAQYNQFILWTILDGKKLPVDYRYARTGDAHNPDMWMDAETAERTAAMFGPPYGIWFVFTENDPFYFLDIDNALNWNFERPDGLSCFELEVPMGLSVFEYEKPNQY